MKSRLRDELVIDPERWQVSLLAVILRVGFLLGSLVYVPSLFAALQADVPGVAVLDTVALATVGWLHLAGRLPFRRRAAIFCLVLYALAVGLLVSVGSISQIYLFGFSILVAVLLGLRAGFGAAVLSSATLFAVGALGVVAPDGAVAAREYGFVGWLATALNFTFVNTLLTLAIGAVLAALNVALRREVAARVSLDRERTLLRTLIDALPDVVFTKDTASRYVTGNPPLLALLGLAREDELAGKTDFDLFPPDLAAAYQADDRSVIAGRPLRNREERSVDRAGQPIWYLTIKVPMTDAGGRVVGLLAIARDITDRKRAEAERDRLLAQLQTQVERMPLAYLLTDADFRLTRWNPTAERMFGFAEAEVLGRHPFEVLVPPQSRVPVADLFEKLRAGSMDSHGEYENRTKDGRTIVCEWYNTPMFDADGAFAGLLSLAQDITGRKNLESQLRQAQKMEAVGRLAGGVAHDFNNLLTIISGYSELQLALPEAGPDVRESAQAINEAGGRAAALTRQLLGFSRQTILQPEVLDLNAVVAETSKMLHRLIGEDILFATVLEPALGRVKVDPGQLDQVLMNLVVNARDAMPRGGRLTVETANVLLDDGYAATHPDCRPGPHVMLAVTDTGCGMTPEVAARVFEPFFTTKAVGNGTGLGLAMVFGIVRQSGGCINVYSEPGRGTTFKIYLPAVADPATRKGDAGVTAGGRRGTETVLLVEDEESVRKLAVLSLQMQGYRVLTATDGADALRVAEAHGGPLDLILTDVVMPNVGGPEMAEALTARFPHVAVLFMSGYTDDAVFRHGLLEADVSFIQKPYTPLGLARKVRQVLDDKKAAVV